MKTQLLKKLSLLLCVCLLLPLFGCANGNASTGQQAAGNKTIQPPFAGVKWGMTVEQVQAALGENLTWQQSNENQYVVNDYPGEIFARQPMYRQVVFCFTKELQYKGETLQPILKEVDITFEDTELDALTEDLTAEFGYQKSNLVERVQSIYGLGQSAVTGQAQNSACFTGNKTIDDVDKDIFRLSFSMYMANDRGEKSAKVEDYLVEQAKTEEQLQTLNTNLIEYDIGKAAYYPTLTLMETAVSNRQQVYVKFCANYSVYDDIAAQYAGK